MSNRNKHISHYRLTRSKYRYWKIRNNLICRKCGIELKEGEMIVSKRRRSKIKTSVSRNLYHEKCAMELYII